ncbi:MAG: hypothetical protein RSB65_08095 [Oscillospiraceae bacterium]
MATDARRIIYCCHCVPLHVIGTRTEQGVKIKHKGREVEAPFPARIKCERCGETTVVCR